MEEQNRMSGVITQYLLRRYERETEEKVQRWLIDETNAAEKSRLLETYWNTVPEGTSPKTYASLAQLKDRLGIEDAPPFERFLRRRSWLRAAAVLLPLAFLAGSYFLLKNIPARLDAVVNISVPYGERREIKLPDASTVFLNAGSSLRYPVIFGQDARRVRLSGEAYFSVTRNTSRPFIVETEHLFVEVLGTEFNVKDYPDETRTTATLNSGKIKVETKTAQSYILTPNQQLFYDCKSKDINIASVNAGDYSLWKEGHLIFDSMTLPEILSVVERKFDVSVRLDNAIDSGNRYTVKFVRSESLYEVMKILEATCGFVSDVEGKVIRLTKK